MLNEGPSLDCRVINLISQPTWLMDYMITILKWMLPHGSMVVVLWYRSLLGPDISHHGMRTARTTGGQGHGWDDMWLQPTVKFSISSFWLSWAPVQYVGSWMQCKSFCCASDRQAKRSHKLTYHWEDFSQTYMLPAFPSCQKSKLLTHSVCCLSLIHFLRCECLSYILWLLAWMVFLYMYVELCLLTLCWVSHKQIIVMHEINLLKALPVTFLIETSVYIINI